MKKFALYALLLLLPSSLLAADQITVETKFIESSKDTVPHDLAHLKDTSGTDIMSAPLVTVTAEHTAKIRVTRYHQPASIAPSSFQPVSIGVALDITPYIKDDKITYAAKYSVSELITDKSPAGQPCSEIVSHDFYVSDTVKGGEELWFDFIEPIKGKKIVVWLRLKKEVY